MTKQGTCTLKATTVLIAGHLYESLKVTLRRSLGQCKFCPHLFIYFFFFFSALTDSCFSAVKAKPMVLGSRNFILRRSFRTKRNYLRSHTSEVTSYVISYEIPYEIISEVSLSSFGTFTIFTLSGGSMLLSCKPGALTVLVIIPHPDSLLIYEEWYWPNILYVPLTSPHSEKKGTGTVPRVL